MSLNQSQIAHFEPCCFEFPNIPFAFSAMFISKGQHLRCGNSRRLFSGKINDWVVATSERTHAGRSWWGQSLKLPLDWFSIVIWSHVQFTRGDNTFLRGQSLWSVFIDGTYIAQRPTKRKWVVHKRRLQQWMNLKRRSFTTTKWNLFWSKWVIFIVFGC